MKQQDTYSAEKVLDTILQYTTPIDEHLDAQNRWVCEYQIPCDRGAIITIEVEFKDFDLNITYFDIEEH